MKDSNFIRKENVPMTKEEIRSISLDYMNIYRAKTMLDVGLGTGSVSIEALVKNRKLKITAIESDINAIEASKENIEKFDEIYKDIKDRIEIIHGVFPSQTFDLKDKIFDCIFIGGTKGNVEEIIESAWYYLNDKGVIVLNFVTIENFSKAMEKIKSDDRFSDYSGGLMSISTFKNLGPYNYLAPNNPTFIVKIQKN